MVLSPPDPAELQVSLSRGCGPAGIPRKDRFERWVRAAAAAAGTQRGELAIRIVDAEEGRTLNREWRQRDHATNVLSFPAGPDGSDGDGDWLGDLALCAAVIQTEAIEQGKPALAHWAHMTVHGVLHILGYDHEEPRAAQRMEALEREILARLGFADPYD